MRRTLLAQLKRDQTFEALLAGLRALPAPEGGGKLNVTNDYRTMPYLGTRWSTGSTDRPTRTSSPWSPARTRTAVVAAVHATRKSAVHYELDAFRRRSRTGRSVVTGNPRASRRVAWR
jgi:hypothetical protein